MAEGAEQAGDPVMRLLIRNRWFEEGGTLTNTASLAVTLDSDEVRVLLGEGKDRDVQAAAANAASAQVARVAAGLHLEHDFTDAWATDGSKKRAVYEGKWQTRVAGGVVEGLQNTGRLGSGRRRKRKCGGAWRQACTGGGCRRVTRW